MGVWRLIYDSSTGVGSVPVERSLKSTEEISASEEAIALWQELKDGIRSCPRLIYVSDVVII